MQNFNDENTSLKKERINRQNAKASFGNTSIRKEVEAIKESIEILEKKNDKSILNHADFTEKNKEHFNYFLEGLDTLKEEINNEIETLVTEEAGYIKRSIHLLRLGIISSFILILYKIDATLDRFHTFQIGALILFIEIAAFIFFRKAGRMRRNRTFLNNELISVEFKKTSLKLALAHGDIDSIKIIISEFAKTDRNHPEKEIDRPYDMGEIIEKLGKVFSK
jgi:hypothetical protein